MLDDLTDDESDLVACARAGEVLTRDAPIRAELIRELLLGRRGELDPRGIRLHGARVVGSLELDYVSVTVGLDLVDCDIEEPIDVSNAVLPRLVLSKSRLAGIQATSLRVTGDALLDGIAVSGDGAGDSGAVRLRGARVGGLLTLVHATVHNDSGPALHADSLHVGGTLFLREARMSGRGDQGAVRLLGAHVGGELNLLRAKIHNDSGPALSADDLTVDTNMIIEQVSISGHGNYGSVQLRGARARGRITFATSEIRNDDGPAVLANRLSVGATLVFLDTEVLGSWTGGSLSLGNARLSDLFMAGHVRNDVGPAIHADGMHVDGTVVLKWAQVAGVGEDGAIWLLGAHVGGVRIAESEIRNDSGPALFADQLQSKGILRLHRTTMSGAGDDATIRLAGASVGGHFSMIDTTVTHPSGLLWDLNDFSYASLGGVDWRFWLDMIRNHTKEYRPSPYQQLAAVERAAGHDGNARNILIAQQHDLRHRSPSALGGWLTQRFHWLWGALAGYGYRARRTALALLIALVASGGVTLWAGHVSTGPGSYAAERTATSGTQCSTVELIGLGLDRGLPLGPTGLRSRCDLDTESTAGQVFTVLLWVVQAAVWGLATLALAGYTGLIRKTA